MYALWTHVYSFLAFTDRSLAKRQSWCKIKDSRSFSAASQTR